jgi:hypothetical protein
MKILPNLSKRIPPNFELLNEISEETNATKIQINVVQLAVELFKQRKKTKINNTHTHS